MTHPHLTQLRWAVTTPDGSERLHTGFYDVASLDVLTRLQISARLAAGGEDVRCLSWTPTIDGERFSRSRLTLGERIKAASGSLEDLLRAIEQNEDECAAVKVRSHAIAPLAVH